MKVKKIEWEKTVIGLHATLPMQLHARISKQGELYKWAIMRGTLSIVTYFTKSEEQAKKDCQKAWEDMVMECFEEGQAEIKEVGNAFSVFHTCRPMYGNDEDDVRMTIGSRLFGGMVQAVGYWNRRA